ncbi:hypothetical protein EJ08DRAFT_650308 [Tothia fuscella]|uniref:tRNA (guanine(9)-N1)-methyltransferase n=1 Tax=Tothia fuscella TaxID=1048955 RepID=A0A9P4NQY0_9PEZI|nr:hypothetical protein EJ08DRAFT_650308 [Tothia fuscella]
MEAEERPSKMRKLSHDTNNSKFQIPGLNYQQNEQKPKPLLQESSSSSMEIITDKALKATNEDPIIEPLVTNPTENPKEKIDPPRKIRTPPPDGLSRSAYKKLKRQQEWDAGRADRRLRQKTKEKAKKAQRRQAISAGLREPSPPPVPKPPSTQLPVTIIFDCSFDDLMFEQEIKSLASQITRCYSDNSRGRYKAHLVVSGFKEGTRLRERFEGPLEGQYRKWKGMRFFEEGFVEVAGMAREWMRNEEHGGVIEGALKNAVQGDQQEKSSSGVDGIEDNTKNSGDMQDDSNPPVTTDQPPDHSHQEGEIIYLSAESDNTLTTLKPYSTYIIGGLVDRNRHKGICFKSANDKGIKTAKLPIGEFLQMNSRYVLTTNHVNEIMLKWLECGDWGEAFMKVIPKRKGGELRGGGDGEEEERDSTNGAEKKRSGDDEKDDEARVAGRAVEDVESEDQVMFTKDALDELIAPFVPR